MAISDVLGKLMKPETLGKVAELVGEAGATGVFRGRDPTFDRAREVAVDRLQQALGYGEDLFGESRQRTDQLIDAIGEQSLRQRQMMEEGFLPFIQAGEQGLDFLTAGATPQGFNERLTEIMGGTPFRAITDQQMKDAMGVFAATGQLGSGGALGQMTQIAPQLALQLEDILTGRNVGLADLGFRGVTGRGQLGSQLFGQAGGMVTELMNMENRLRDAMAGRGMGLISGMGGVESDALIKSSALERERKSALNRLIGGGVGTVLDEVFDTEGGIGRKVLSKIGGMF